MIKQTITLAILVLCCFSVALAADITGEWESHVEGPEGSMDFSFTFKVDGSTLTGTMTSQWGAAPLQNGKIEGDDFTFEIDAEGYLFSYTGKVVDENTLQLTMEQFQAEMELTRKTTAAVNIDGRWQGEMDSPNMGPMVFVFNFKVDGDNLTGTIESDMGEMPISNGKVNGAEFSFDVDAGGMVISHQCIYTDDTITLTVPGFGDNSEMILKRISEE